MYLFKVKEGEITLEMEDGSNHVLRVGDEISIVGEQTGLQEALVALRLEEDAYLCGIAVGTENWHEVVAIAERNGISTDLPGDEVTDALVYRARQARRAALGAEHGAAIQPQIPPSNPPQ